MFAEIHLMRTVPMYRFDRENLQRIADHFLEEDEDCHSGRYFNVNKSESFIEAGYIGDPGFPVGVGKDYTKGIYTKRCESTD